MLVTARIAGFLLLFVLVTASLSDAYLGQGGDDHAAGKCNLVVSSRKVISMGTQTTSENKIRGRKMVSDHDYMKMETTKEIGVRAKDLKRSRFRIARENYQARFVAFNADYKGPRHHPPKNN